MSAGSSEHRRPCGSANPDHLPPAYAALNIPSYLVITGQMYESIVLCKWVTCVVCYRAWYDLQADYHFDELVVDNKVS